MSGFYLSMDLEYCRARKHKFIAAGSDVTPLKRSLLCVTCTDANPGKTAYCAYGIEVLSFGAWRRIQPKDEEL